MSYKIHSVCRGCGYGAPNLPEGLKAPGTNEKLVSVLNLGVMPLANAFRKPNEPQPGHYPVQLLVCPRCNLGQLSATVDPGVLYANYPYVTSPSEMMRQHFDALWKQLNFYRKIETVVEIGSNDGLCLHHFLRLGAQHVMGIDPAENLVKIAHKRGVNTICSLFNMESAAMAARALPPIDLVLARHVFCHADDWREFIKSVEVLCSKETVVCIEVPYAEDTIANCEWDTVYSEHLSYLTLRSIRYLLEGSGVWLQGVLKFSIHGGAICLILRRRDSEVQRDGAVDELIQKEKCALEDWKEFAARSGEMRADLFMTVTTLRSQAKRICGYGASAKSTVWINSCHFSRKEIEFICDATPQKVYTTCPGTDIPIVQEGEHYTQCIDYVILWAWNFALEIMERERKLGHTGFKWIIPVPEVKILDGTEVLNATTLKP